VAWDGPLVVLISKLSASASEIFAGAVQDYRRGIVVGDQTTHGKGTVQTLRELGRELFVGPNAPQLGALKITMQKFYRPNGDSTQKRGVVSDIELPSLTTHLDVGEGDLDYAMEFDRVPAASFKQVNLLDTAMVSQLRDLSQQRCEKSSDFQKLARDIARYQQQKERKTVPLNEAKFLAERAELNAEKEEEKLHEDNRGTKPVVADDDYHLKEALSIALDYLQMVRVARN
jgi:carboxyl-terminal processing protease